ncbi:MAG: GEVED domain-containing protein [Gammaproteobacteria bacterium]|nr:GEVED domain-containing protein [Gammaproteobacteria bacterium]
MSLLVLACLSSILSLMSLSANANEEHQDLYPEHPQKSSHVMFVDDVTGGRLYPGEKIGNDYRWLVYQHDGNLVFYTKTFGTTEVEWATHTHGYCAGHMELSPYYGITVVDCNGTRRFQLYNSPLEHTNFHLDLFGQQLRLFNMDDRKKVWAVQGDNGCSIANSCVNWWNTTLSNSDIRSIWIAQGWSLPDLYNEDFDAFFDLMNDHTYADSHADGHRALRGHVEVGCISVNLDKECSENNVPEQKSALRKAWDWLGESLKWAAEHDCVQGFECATLDDDFFEVKLFSEFTNVIKGLSGGLQNGTIDAEEFLRAMMVTITPDKETDVEIYNGLGRFINLMQKDEDNENRMLSGAKDDFWKGAMAKAIGKSSGNLRLDMAPIELKITFKDLTDFVFGQIKDHTGVNPRMKAFFNSIQIRLFVTWPSFDPANNRSDFDIRLRIQDLAGAKFDGPIAGALEKYANLDFDAGPSTLHEWQWKFTHDIEEGETKLMKRDYQSSLSFIVEGTFSPSKWVEQFLTIPAGAPTNAAGEVQLTNLSDNQLTVGSIVNSQEASLAASDGSASSGFMTAQDMQGAAQAFNNMSAGGKNLADTMLSYDATLASANTDLTLGAQVGTTSLLDVPVDYFVQETADGFEVALNNGDNLGYFQDLAKAMQDGVVTPNEIPAGTRAQSVVIIDTLSSVEVQRLRSSISSNSSVLDSVTSIVSGNTQDSAEIARVGPMKWFLQTLAWLAGQYEAGISCGLTTKYFLLERDWEGNIKKEMSQSDQMAVYGMQVVTSVIGGGLSAFLASETGEPVLAGNAGQMAASYFAGDMWGRNALFDGRNEFYDHGAACGIWAAYRPVKLGIPDDWIPTFAPKTLGKSLGLDVRQRLQLNWEFIGRPDFVPFRRLSGNEVQDLSQGWKTYNLPQFKEKSVLLNQMQTYDDPDTANVRTDHMSPSSFKVFIEEEQSKETEMGHATEAVATIALTEGDILNKAGFTIGESGRLSANAATATDYKTLTFKNRYINPIVIMEMSSYRGPHPSHIRLSDKTASSVKYKIEEWDYLDGGHTTEDISYIVIEAGSHMLQAGEMAVAGELDANTSAFTTVNISSFANGNRFDSDSLTTVFVQPHEGQSDPYALTSRIKSVNAQSFQVKVEREESQQNLGRTEEVGFIAFGSHYDPQDPNPVYCEARGSNQNYEYIGQVNLGNLGAVSNAAGYTFEQNTGFSVNRGVGKILEVIPTFPGSSYNEYFKAWIDYDKNGVFDDNEKVLDQRSSSPVSATVNLPDNALVGVTRMRVVMDYYGEIDACGSFTYGEVEDYRITIN